MSLRDNDRASLVLRFQRGRVLREAAIEAMDANKKIGLFPLAFLANIAFGNPRYAGRTAKRIMRRYNLPPADTIEESFARLIFAPSDTLQRIIAKLGLLVMLKQLPKLMKREDIETLNVVFGTDAVVFVMENRALAPVWPHNILRLPDNIVLHEQAVRYGWIALMRWMDAVYPETAGWFILRLPQDFAPLKESFPQVHTAFAAVEKALEELHDQDDEMHSDHSADDKELSEENVEEGDYAPLTNEMRDEDAHV